MLTAITICRNSAWVIRATLSTALRYCDAVAVLDHASEDATPDVLSDLAREHPGRVSWVREDDPVWREMDHRQRVLDLARSHGGTVFVNVDDDEILTFNLHECARHAALSLAPGAALTCPLLCVWDGLTHYRADDTEWSRCVTYLAFADTSGMTFKPAGDGYQFHNRRPSGSNGSHVDLIPPDSREGGVLHLQFASRRRLLAKQALYKITETVCWPGRRTAAELNAMYDNTTLNIPRGMVEMSRDWVPEEIRAMIDIDAEPWQDAACRRAVAFYGRDRFAGLDLYGVV
jgi:hypothetical protein